MRGRLQVLEVWGIPIRVHFSWLLVFGLVTWSLAAGYFPREYPGWPVRTYWAVGAVTALALFASILIHELGHSWVALRNRIPIRSITLFVFGGVAQIAREPGGPGAELRIAIARPVPSFALAGLFVGAWPLVREWTTPMSPRCPWSRPASSSAWSAASRSSTRSGSALSSGPEPAAGGQALGRQARLARLTCGGDASSGGVRLRLGCDRKVTASTRESPAPRETSRLAHAMLWLWWLTPAEAR
jgi:hypothetical protein